MWTLGNATGRLYEHLGYREDNIVSTEMESFYVDPDFCIPKSIKRVNGYLNIKLILFLI